MLGTNEGDDIEVGVGLIQSQVILEFFVELQSVGGLVGSEDVDDAVAGLVGVGFVVVEDGVALEVGFDLDWSQRVVAAVVEEGNVVAAVTLVHLNLEYYYMGTRQLFY